MSVMHNDMVDKVYVGICKKAGVNRKPLVYSMTEVEMKKLRKHLRNSEYTTKFKIRDDR
jgi:ribosomal protein S13